MAFFIHEKHNYFKMLKGHIPLSRQTQGKRGGVAPAATNSSSSKAPPSSSSSSSTVTKAEKKAKVKVKAEAPVVYSSERALVEDLKKIAKRLAEVTEEWDVRVEALNHLQKIALESGAHRKYSSAFFEHMHGAVRDGVIRQLGDLRSSVSIAAAQCIKTLAASLGEQLGADPYVAAILRIMGTTNQVIKDAAHSAMLAIIEDSRLGRAGLAKLVETIRTSKNSAQKLRATEYLRRVVALSTKYTNGLLEKAADDIEGAVRKALSDGDPSVRAEGRLAFSAYCSAWPVWATAFLESLEPSVKKYIGKDVVSQSTKPANDTAATAATTAVSKISVSTRRPQLEAASKAVAAHKPPATAAPAKAHSDVAPAPAHAVASTVVTTTAAAKRLGEKRRLPEQKAEPEAKKFAQATVTHSTLSSATQRIHAAVTTVAPAIPTAVVVATTTVMHSAQAKASTVSAAASSSTKEEAPGDVGLALRYGSKDSPELKRKAVAMLREAVREEKNKNPRVVASIKAITSFLKSVLASDACKEFEAEALEVILGLFEHYAPQAAYHIDDVLPSVFALLSRNSEHSELCERILEAARAGVNIDLLLGLARKLVLCHGKGPGLESYAVLVFLGTALEKNPENFATFARTKALTLCLASVPVSSCPQALKDKATEVLQTLYGVAPEDFVRSLKTLPPNVYANTVKKLPFLPATGEEEEKAKKDGDESTDEDAKAMATTATTVVDESLTSETNAMDIEENKGEDAKMEMVTAVQNAASEGESAQDKPSKASEEVADKKEKVAEECTDACKGDESREGCDVQMKDVAEKASNEEQTENAETTASVEKVVGALKVASEKFRKRCPEGFGGLSELIEKKPFLSEESVDIIAYALCGCLSGSQQNALRATTLVHMKAFTAAFSVSPAALRKVFTTLITIIDECNAQGDAERMLTMANSTLLSLEESHPAEVLQMLLGICRDIAGPQVNSQDDSSNSAEKLLTAALHGLGSICAKVDKAVLQAYEDLIVETLAGHVGSDALATRKEAVYCIGECVLAHPEREKFTEKVGAALTPVQMMTVQHYIDRKKH